MFLDCVNNIYKQYGLEPYTLEEEANLPETIKQIRQDKIGIIDYCSRIRRELEMIESRARGAVEKDDLAQQRRVDEFADLVYEGLMKLEKAAVYGVR